MTGMHKYLILCILPLMFIVNANAQKKTYTTQRLEGTAPRIDGNFDDEVWEQVEWADNFVQIQPHAEAPATQKTRFKVIYDDNNIYFAVRCFDTAPDSIVKRMARRDYDVGDWVKIVIDSYHDLKTAFSFGVSAAGVKIDEIITDGGNWDNSWEPIWDVKTAHDDQGWTVEASIPFSQLRFSQKEEYIWGLDIGRRLYREEEYSVWQFFSPTAPEIVHLFGELHGIKNIKPRKQKEITPYVATGLETYDPEEGNPFADGLDVLFNAGLDGKVGVTNNLTLDFSINPDFGQVEADPSEMNLSTYETYFAEKRPFFIEGKNILSFRLLNGGGPFANDNLFYSRRIGSSPSYWPDLADGEYARRPDNTSILGAFKLTGKTEEGWSLGIMESFTQKEHATISREGDSEREKVTIEPFSNYFVSRVQRDMNQSNTQLGAMFTATNRRLGEPALQDFMHSQAYSSGIDFFHQWKDKTYYINVIAAASRVIGTREAIYNTQVSAPHFYQRPGQDHMTPDTNATHLDGFSATVQAGKAGNGKFQYLIWLTARSPGFHLNDLGYHNRNDEIQEVFWIGFRQTEPWWIFRSINLNLNQWYGSSSGFEYKYFGGNFNGHATFKNYWSIGGGGDREGSGFDMETLRGGPAMRYNGATSVTGYIQTDERKKIMFAYQNYFSRSDQKIAGSFGHYAFMRVQLSDAWNFSLNPGFSRNFYELAYVTTLEDLEEPRYIRGQIDQTTVHMTVRNDVSITPDLTIQLYFMPFISGADYTDFKYITDAGAENFTDRFVTYDGETQLSYNEANAVYEVDENADGTMDYSFDQPDFRFFDYNMNLVGRWEYKPGSIIYLVWSLHGNDYNNDGDFRFRENIRPIHFDADSRSIVLLKLSHRFGL